jgi:hypothetical protein
MFNKKILKAFPLWLEREKHVHCQHFLASECKQEEEKEREGRIQRGREGRQGEIA